MVILHFIQLLRHWSETDSALEEAGCNKIKCKKMAKTSMTDTLDGAFSRILKDLQCEELLLKTTLKYYNKSMAPWKQHIKKWGVHQDFLHSTVHYQDYIGMQPTSFYHFVPENQINLIQSVLFIALAGSSSPYVGLLYTAAVIYSTNY